MFANALAKSRRETRARERRSRSALSAECVLRESADSLQNRWKWKKVLGRDALNFTELSVYFVRKR